MKTEIKKLSKKALRKSYWNWAFFHLSSMNFAKFQTYGFLHSMYPVIKELYFGDEDSIMEAFERHSVVFNVEPVMGAAIPGIVAGLEESKANGADIDSATINEVKVGLMGPLAGIGDTLSQGLVVPIALSIGISMSTNGSVMGALFFIAVSILFNIVFSNFLFRKGYKLGVKAIDLFLGDTAIRLQEAFKVLGLISLGAIAAAYINLNLTLVVQDINIQDLLDSIFPKLIPLLLLFGAWLLRLKKQIKPTTLILVLMLISIVGVVIGIF